MRTPHRRGDRGQSTVEFAIVLPGVLVAILLLVQVGLVVRDQLLVIGAAREGARAAAVDTDPSAARDAVVAHGALDPSRLAVARGPRTPGGPVTVTVTYRPTSIIPGLSSLLNDLELSADATMRAEA